LRHSYIDRPRRIRAPRATPPSRTRFLPAVVALPVVAVLWVTVGLPVLSQVTGAGGGNRLARSVVFGAQATGTGGGTGGASSVPQTEAAAIVSEKVLAAYHAEVAKRARARARAAAKLKLNVIGAKVTLPQPALSASAPNSATFATADQPQAPTSQPSATPPAKDTSPAAGNSPGSGGSSDSGDTTDPGSGDTTTTPPDSGDTGGSDAGGTGDTGDTGVPATRATRVTSAGAPAAARRRLRLRRLRRLPRLRLPPDLRPLRHPRRAPCRHPRTYRPPVAAAHMARLQPVMRLSTRS
jgi:hypothetical protein